MPDVSQTKCPDTVFPGICTASFFWRTWRTPRSCFFLGTVISGPSRLPLFQGIPGHVFCLDIAGHEGYDCCSDSFGMTPFRLLFFCWIPRHRWCLRCSGLNSLSFQASYEVSGSINMPCISSLDSFFRSAESHSFATALYALYRYLAIPFLGTVVTLFAETPAYIHGMQVASRWGANVVYLRVHLI